MLDYWFIYKQIQSAGIALSRYQEVFSRFARLSPTHGEYFQKKGYVGFLDGLNNLEHSRQDYEGASKGKITEQHRNVITDPNAKIVVQIDRAKFSGENDGIWVLALPIQPHEITIHIDEDSDNHPSAGYKVLESSLMTLANILSRQDDPNFNCVENPFLDQVIGKKPNSIHGEEAEIMSALRVDHPEDGFGQVLFNGQLGDLKDQHPNIAAQNPIAIARSVDHGYELKPEMLMILDLINAAYQNAQPQSQLSRSNVPLNFGSIAWVNHHEDILKVVGIRNKETGQFLDLETMQFPQAETAVPKAAPGPKNTIATLTAQLTQATAATRAAQTDADATRKQAAEAQEQLDAANQARERAEEAAKKSAEKSKTTLRRTAFGAVAGFGLAIAGLFATVNEQAGVFLEDNLGITTPGAEAAGMRATINEQETLIAEQNTEISGLRAELSTMTREFDALNGKIEALQARNAGLQTGNTNLSAEVTRLKRSLVESTKKYLELLQSESSNGYEDILKSMLEQNQTLLEAVDALSQSNSDLDGIIDELLADLEDASKAIRSTGIANDNDSDAIAELLTSDHISTIQRINRLNPDIGDDGRVQIRLSKEQLNALLKARDDEALINLFDDQTVEFGAEGTAVEERNSFTIQLYGGDKLNSFIGLLKSEEVHIIAANNDPALIDCGLKFTERGGFSFVDALVDAAEPTACPAVK